MPELVLQRGGGFKLILSVMAAIGLVAAVWQTYQLLLVMFGGVLLAVFLRHMARVLRRIIPVPPGVGVVIVVILVVLVMVIAGWLFASTVRNQVTDLSRTLPDVLASLQVWTGSRWLNHELWGDLSPSVFLSGRTDRILSLVSNFFSQATSLVTAAVVAAIMAFYMAIEPEPYLYGGKMIWPDKWRSKVDKIFAELNHFLWWWLLGRVVSMMAVGILSFIGLNLLGAPYSFVLALLAGLLTIIPYLGPILSAIPAVLVGLSVSVSLALGLLVMFVIVQIVEGNLVTPLVERKTLRLPPALTIGSQLLFGVLAGPVGIVLASPLTVVGVVVVRILRKN